MTDETRKKLGVIALQIDDYREEVRDCKRRLSKAEAEIAKLEAERWQLVLTQ